MGIEWPTGKAQLHWGTPPNICLSLFGALMAMGLGQKQDRRGLSVTSDCYSHLCRLTSKTQGLPCLVTLGVTASRTLSAKRFFPSRVVNDRVSLELCHPSPRHHPVRNENIHPSRAVSTQPLTDDRKLFKYPSAAEWINVCGLSITQLWRSQPVGSPRKLVLDEMT